MRRLTIITAGLLGLVGACGGKQAPGGGGSMSDMDRRMGESMSMAGDDASTYGPLEVGADWRSYVKVNTTPVRSETHGGRLVDTYVNAIGAAAYIDDDGELPVGTVLVKTSFERDGSPGPLFVMEKQPPGSDPDRGDWSYAIHWADPPAAWKPKLGGPIYWRTPSRRADYCVECHENYDRYLGNVPASQRITSVPR